MHDPPIRLVGLTRPWIRGALAALFLVPLAVAQRQTQKSFSVPAGDATVTLPRFIEQAGEQLAYLVDNVRGEKTNAVTGPSTARQALDQMLAGTRLTASQDK